METVLTTFFDIQVNTAGGQYLDFKRVPADDLGQIVKLMTKYLDTSNMSITKSY